MSVYSWFPPLLLFLNLLKSIPFLLQQVRAGFLALAQMEQGRACQLRLRWYKPTVLEK